MSYLDRMSHRDGVGSYLLHGTVETAEFAGASYGFGYLQNRWRQYASVRGVPVDLLAGVALKVVSLGSHLLGVGEAMASHANNVANAGIGSFFHTLGAGHGGQHAGVTRVLTDKEGAKKIKGLIPNATILGAIPKAPKGDFLSSKELAELAR